MEDDESDRILFGAAAKVAGISEDQGMVTRVVMLYDIADAEGAIQSRLVHTNVHATDLVGLLEYWKYDILTVAREDEEDV